MLSKYTLVALFAVIGFISAYDPYPVYPIFQGYVQNGQKPKVTKPVSYIFECVQLCQNEPNCVVIEQKVRNGPCNLYLYGKIQTVNQSTGSVPKKEENTLVAMRGTTKTTGYDRYELFNNQTYPMDLNKPEKRRYNVQKTATGWNFKYDV